MTPEGETGAARGEGTGRELKSCPACGAEGLALSWGECHRCGWALGGEAERVPGVRIDENGWRGRTARERGLEAALVKLMRVTRMRHPSTGPVDRELEEAMERARAAVLAK